MLGNSYIGLNNFGIGNEGNVTSVGLVMPSPASPAYTVSNSPVTGSGNLTVTANGTTSQYVRGDGSLATFPSLTGYVPYTGATTDVVLGNFSLSAKSIFITGAGGNGFQEYIAQSSAPTAPTSGFRFYANSTNALSWIGQNGFTRTFDGTSNTANRVYTLPNATTTVAGLSVGTSGTPQAFTGYNTFSALTTMTNNTLGENILTLNSNRTQTGSSQNDIAIRLVQTHTNNTGNNNTFLPIVSSSTVTINSGGNNTIGCATFTNNYTDNSAAGTNVYRGIDITNNLTHNNTSTLTPYTGFRMMGAIAGAGGGNKDISGVNSFSTALTFNAGMRSVTNIDYSATPTYGNSTNLTGTGYYYSATLGTYLGAVQHRAFWNTNGDVYLCSSAGNVGIGTAPSSTDKFQISGNISLVTAGNKIKIATGTNASIGTSAAMVAGTVTVNTTAVTANSRIQLTINTVGGTVGVLSAPTASIIAGTSFVINSSSNTDTSTVNWWIIN
ncbi:MAG: hypothetical protein ACOVOV_02215 [Dolichospermum sp.]